MPLRVLLIDTNPEWRGGPRQVLLLAHGLRARGYEPLVVTVPGSPLATRLRARGLAVAAVRVRGEWDLVAARRVRALVRTWRPDVVHAHESRAHALALAALVRRTTPLVVTRRSPRTPRSPRLSFGPRVARVVAISRFVRDALVVSGVDASRVAVVHPGVPTPSVERPRDWRSECRWPNEAVLCGVVGSLADDRGIAMLTAIATRLPDEARRHSRLLLLGGPNLGAADIGGVEAFRVGFVDEIHAAIAGLDLLWHPAGGDGLGTAVVDAMALGVPPVAFASGSLPELIEDGVVGVLVPPGDIDGFATAVAGLVNDEALRRRLAEAGPRRASHFGVRRMVEEMESVYAAAMAGIP